MAAKLLIQSGPTAVQRLRSLVPPEIKVIDNFMFHHLDFFYKDKTDKLFSIRIMEYESDDDILNRIQKEIKACQLLGQI